MNTDGNGLLSAAAGLMFGAVLASAAEKPLPAFPGAEGWGCDTPGGRGGKVMIVTNLNPDGPGSLQEACAAAGPRIVVFEVSGVISNTITIENSNITIAGQTAPGAGITIAGMLVSKPGIADIVVRYLRVRPPPVRTVILPQRDGGGALAVRLRKIGVEMKNPHENWYAEYDGVKMTRARTTMDMSTTLEVTIPPPEFPGIQGRQLPICMQRISQSETEPPNCTIS